MRNRGRMGAKRNWREGERREKSLKKGARKRRLKKKEGLGKEKKWTRRRGKKPRSRDKCPHLRLERITVL